METFKINYKSDFVLRLASDAGWGTAFTLEFWSKGAPTKRYYATHDGNGNYTNCKPDSDTELRVMFDDHGLGIGNLMLRITYSLADKEFRTGKDDEVVNVAAITVLNDEGEEVDVMLSLEGETAPLIQYALPLLGNELERRRAEQERIEAEEERKSNEATRIDNEYLRVSNENKRKAAEQSRAENENARVAAENERLTNENLRQQQEDERLTNENLRQQQEDERRATFEQTQEERAEAYLAKEAARQADFEAKEESRQATFEANEARREADTNDTIAAAEAAAGNANSAADRTNKAIADASAATSFANQSAAKANTAAANADTATDNANAATAESKAATKDTVQVTEEARAATEDTLAKIAILVPSALTVDCIKRITWGNVTPVKIKAVLSPVTAMKNLIFLSDNRAVEVSKDGVLTPVAKGVSRVHVIPTMNTELSQTCLIEVCAPRLRLSSSTKLRFTQAGGLRLT